MCVEAIVRFRVGSSASSVSVCRMLSTIKCSHLAHSFAPTPHAIFYTPYFIHFRKYFPRCCQMRWQQRHLCDHQIRQTNIKKWNRHHEKNANVHPFKCGVAYAFHANIVLSLHSHLSSEFRIWVFYRFWCINRIGYITHICGRHM